MTARCLVALLTVLLGLFTRPATSQTLTPAPEPSPITESAAVTDAPELPLLPGQSRIGDMIVELLARPDGATEFYASGSAKWPGGILPVTFEAAVTTSERQQFFSLCNNVWGGMANVRCVDRTTQPGWVHVTKSYAGCYAYVGTTGTGMRQLNLQANACWTQRIILHEIGHAFGFGHEHQRPGRDTFVEIRRQNIQAGMEDQFYVFNQGSGDFYTTQYDFGSIMHYASTAFSSNGQPTIVPRPAYASIAGNFGNVTVPSDNDGAILRALYGSPAAITVPGAPTGLEASATGTQINLSWRAPTTGGAATSYYITVRTTVGAVLWAGDIGNYLGANGTFNAGTYVFAVQGRNAAGLGAAATVQVTVGSTAGGRPGTPGSFTSNVQGSTITLSWSAPVTPGPVESYVLHYGFTPGFASGYTVDLGNRTSVSFGNVPVGTYYMRLFARNGYGNSSESNEVRVVVAGASAPGVPSLLPVQSRGGNTFAISWLPGAGATPTHYLLDVSSTPNGGPDIGTLQLTGTGLLTGTVPRGLYYLRLRAVNAAGVSAQSPAQALLAQ